MASMQWLLSRCFFSPSLSPRFKAAAEWKVAPANITLEREGHRGKALQDAEVGLQRDAV